MLQGLNEILSYMSLTVSSKYMLHKVVVSFLSLQQSGIIEISKSGLVVREMMLPKPDVVNAQGSLNPDAKPRLPSVP